MERSAGADAPRTIPRAGVRGRDAAGAGWAVELGATSRAHSDVAIPAQRAVCAVLCPISLAVPVRRARRSRLGDVGDDQFLIPPPAVQRAEVPDEPALVVGGDVRPHTSSRWCSQKRSRNSACWWCARSLPCRSPTSPTRSASDWFDSHPQPRSARGSDDEPPNPAPGGRASRARARVARWRWTHRRSRHPAAERGRRHRHPPGLERGPVAGRCLTWWFSFDTHSGPVIEIEGPEEFGAFGAKANARFAFYEYIPLNFVVTIDSDDSARGRSYSLEVAEDRAGEWFEFYGTYQDEYAVFEGTWRFASRHYQTYGRRTGGMLTSFPWTRRALSACRQFAVVSSTQSATTLCRCRHMNSWSLNGNDVTTSDSRLRWSAITRLSSCSANSFHVADGDLTREAFARRRGRHVVVGALEDVRVVGSRPEVVRVVPAAFPDLDPEVGPDQELGVAPRIAPTGVDAASDRAEVGRVPGTEHARCGWRSPSA